MILKAIKTIQVDVQIKDEELVSKLEHAGKSSEEIREIVKMLYDEDYEASFVEDIVGLLQGVIDLGVSDIDIELQGLEVVR